MMGLELEMVKKVQKRMFWVIMCIMVLVGGGVSAGLFYGGEWLRSVYVSDQGPAMILDKISIFIDLLNQNNTYQWLLPGTLILAILIGGLFWLVLSLSVAAISKEGEVEPSPNKPNKSSKKDFIDQKIAQERKRRLFLHSLSVLQREGRLLDFFDEDLGNYDDAQIGAAVRSIQEDCKKAIKKYIDPKPVISGDEGESITIDEGFDIDAIKLIGNVAGQPPFQGVIKHPGWKAGKKDVPKLSDIQDPGIMTPAEVEIQ
jgi:hypothetical protein